MADPYQIAVQFIGTEPVIWLYDPTLFSGAGGFRPAATTDFGGSSGGSSGTVIQGNNAAGSAGNWSTNLTEVGGAALALNGDGGVPVHVMNALNLVLGSGTNVIGEVLQAGSAGTDYSANKPTLPNVGANFATSGPYANYVLVATVPANATRANLDVENLSGAQVLLIRDDGTAASAAAPVNASLVTLAGGSAAGAQGGSWSSTTFKGRLQVYAPSSSALVSVFVD